MVANTSNVTYRRAKANFVDRGESFAVRANVVACIHGAMGHGENYATLLAIEFEFSSPRRRRRGRMANIALVFTTEGADMPEVVDFVPKNIEFDRGSEETSSISLEPTTNIGVDGNISINPTRDKLSAGRVVGETHYDGHARPNGARWIIQENESTKAGIPRKLIVAVLLRRTDNNPFSMVPNINVKVSGFAFEDQLLTGQRRDDPVVFNPNLASMLRNLPIGLTEVDQDALEGFWKSWILQMKDGHFMPQAVKQGSDLLHDDPVPAVDGESAPITTIAESREDSSWLDQIITGAVYTELWNVEGAKSGATRSFRDRWEDLGDSLNPDGLSKILDKFSWLTKEIKSPDVSVMEGELQSLQTNMTGDARPEAKGRPINVYETTHNLCSLLVRKAKTQESFKSFQDLSGELFNEETIDKIAECFFMKDHYNGFRKFDFGSCEFRPTGEEGRELSMYYIIQTPYYSRGFWSMFLVGRPDPKDPDQARKLSGLIQSGADVKLREILDAVTSTAKGFDYHPLLLPYHLYLNHYEDTSKQFDKVLKRVEDAEEGIKKALDSKGKLISEAQGKIDHDPSQWGLANLSKLLHEASMEVSELARRRRFEDDLAKALKNELRQKRPAQNRMLRSLDRYDSWAKAHQSEIDGMPGKIDSLKTLLYSMIAQYDNLLSIKLAKEALSDSKAMKTLSLMTILFLPGTFIATIFTTNVVTFQNSSAETMAYIEVVIPLTVGLMILYGLWLWKAPEWSKSRERKGDEEAGCMGTFSKNLHTAGKRVKIL